jgi:transcriptional regulator with XRE-family HTH domain
MRKRKIKVVVLKEDLGYSASTTIGDRFIATEADSFGELKSRLMEALHFTFEETGEKFTLQELVFEFDLESFFDFYRVINAKALSERIGMNQSLLAQYIKGIKKPSPAQTRRILKGVQQIGHELTEVRFLL